MIRVAVFGATGYGGSEVIRLLAGHPDATVVAVTSDRLPGHKISEECPWLASDLVLESTERVIERSAEYDVAFLAVEARRATPLVEALIESVKIIDHSADHRLKDPKAHATYYKTPWSTYAEEAVYGLPEIVPAETIAAARLVANPGCHPTAALLGLVPLARAAVYEGVTIVDSKTGVSGAGRSAREFNFSEIDGGLKAYATVGHRHTAEIEQFAGLVRFTPHLVPFARGLHTTAYVKLARQVNADELRALIADAYIDRPFVRVVGSPPSTKQVLGSNRCDISVDVDSRTGYAVICAVIDNLVKGMAGQAIQNMNLMFGLNEATGLPLNGVWP